MAGEMCPLFERTGGDRITLIGAWMLHPVNLDIVPDSANFIELGHIGPMVAKYVRDEPCRQVNNDAIDLGRSCKFLGGAFLMGHAHPAPNEVEGTPGSAFDYEMKDNDGITICIRERC